MFLLVWNWLSHAGLRLVPIDTAWSSLTEAMSMRPDRIVSLWISTWENGHENATRSNWNRGSILQMTTQYCAFLYVFNVLFRYWYYMKLFELTIRSLCALQYGSLPVSASSKYTKTDLKVVVQTFSSQVRSMNLISPCTFIPCCCLSALRAFLLVQIVSLFHDIRSRGIDKAG